MSPKDLHLRLTSAVRCGLAPWRLYHSTHDNAGFPASPLTGRPLGFYNGLQCALTAHQRPFRSRWWGTAEDWAELGGRADSFAPTAVMNPDHTVTWVYNAEEVRGLQDRWLAPDAQPPDRFDLADGLIRQAGAAIDYRRGDKACYQADRDRITFPLREQFAAGPYGVNAFYDSLFHELGHWTESRTGWDGDDALCELRSEITAGVLCSLCQLRCLPPTGTHRKWLPRWLELLDARPSRWLDVTWGAAQGVRYLFEAAGQELQHAS